MTNQQNPSKIINIILWVAQVILAVTLIWAAAMKFFQPIEKLALMWPWVAQIPEVLVKVTGLVDLLGGLGLILPGLFRTQPKLTPITAIAIIVLMICACIFHISRGEASEIGFNIGFALVAAFIVWGRFKSIIPNGRP